MNRGAPPSSAASTRHSSVLAAFSLVHYHRADSIDHAKETARLAREAGAARTALAAGDLGDPQKVKRMFDIAERELGGIDILVGNAGRAIRKPLAELTDDEYRSCQVAISSKMYLTDQFSSLNLRTCRASESDGTSLLHGLRSDHARCSSIITPPRRQSPEQRRSLAS